MINASIRAVGAVAAGVIIALVASNAQAQTGARPPEPAPPPLLNEDASLNVPAFRLPFSEYASEEAKKEQADKFARMGELAVAPPDPGAANPVAAHRALTDRILFTPWLEAQRRHFNVRMTEGRIGGVEVQYFEPAAGIAPANKDRVLINLHGGAFAIGWGIVSQIESIPIAATAGIKVVSVNYRMFPEGKFPAGSEDVAAVYSELLKSHAPSNIGIYGCSAGGMLTSQSVAWFDKEGLPLPSSIAILSAAIDAKFSGDSAYVTPNFGSFLQAPNGQLPPYFMGADMMDPLVSPSSSPDLLKKFPPTLLLTGTRAGDMSATVQSQLTLLDAGVDARMLLWDGVDHCFTYNPDLPESRAAYRHVAQFFERNMGKAKATR